MPEPADDNNESKKAAENFADQPQMPNTDPKKCGFGTDAETPVKVKDPLCSKCVALTKCDCPTKPEASKNCLEDLIDDQNKLLAEAKKTELFRNDIQALLAKATAVTNEYTLDTYQTLIDSWKGQDDDIVRLISNLVCTVRCWKCAIECYICPLLNEIRFEEKKVNGDGSAYEIAYDLQDLQYWRTRDKDRKERRYQRVKGVLVAWEKPVQTIEKVLAENKSRILTIRELIGTSQGKAIYHLFLRLIPLHLAIAPPKSSGIVTQIKKKYTDFCVCTAEHCDDDTDQAGATDATPAVIQTAKKSSLKPDEKKCKCCDEPKPETCCGPNVGEPTIRERLIGAQPYLIKPDEYYSVICCLVNQYYLPAKESYSDAVAQLDDVNTKIERSRANVSDGLKNFEKNVLAMIPNAIDCSVLKEKEEVKEEEMKPDDEKPNREQDGIVLDDNTHAV